MRQKQIAERSENGVRIRVMAPDPKIQAYKDAGEPIAARDDSRKPYQNYRRRELETGRGRW
jgi:hypothetical protein